MNANDIAATCLDKLGQLAPLQIITPAQFIADVFGALDPNGPQPLVCTVQGNPKPPNGLRAIWDHSPPTAEALARGAGLNWYSSLATYRPDAQGRYARQRKHCAAVYGLLCDDIGEKIDASRLALLPSALTVTSAGSAQAIYLFDQPQADLAMVDALHAAIRDAGLCDPRADGPSARLSRIPYGINGKDKPGMPPGGCPVRASHWYPFLRYSPAEIVKGLGLKPRPARSDRALAYGTEGAAWQALGESQRAELVGDLESALTFIPSDDRRVWIKTAYALRASLPDEVGFPLWEKWSQKAATFNPYDDLEDIYLGCLPDDPPRTGAAAIFAEAKKNPDYVNPRSVAAVDLATVGFGKDAPQLPGMSATPLPPRPPAASMPAPEVRLVRADSVPVVAIPWLWHGFLPAGMLALLGGSPGCGKTTIALSLAAAVSSGGQWPDGTVLDAPGDVLVWSGEDLTSILAGRLRAMGANLERVHFVGDMPEGAAVRAFDPGRDMPALEAAARTLAAPRLLIVDPIVSAVAGDSHKNAEVRRSLQPIVDLAGRVGCAVLGITHFSKGTVGRDPAERLTGSLAFVALARMVLIAAKIGRDEEAEPRRVFMRAESNIGPDRGGFAYTLDRVEIAPGIEGQRVQWGESHEESARELLAEAEAPTASAAADPLAGEMAQFVRDQLSAGAIESKDFQREAQGAGHRWNKVKEVASRMGAKAFKEPGNKNGPWRWHVADRAIWERSAFIGSRTSPPPRTA